MFYDEEKNLRTFKCHKTRTGKLSLWEFGGAIRHFASATLIATPRGKKPEAIYVTTKNNVNSQHALVLVRKDFIIAWGQERSGTVNICLYVVQKLDKDKGELTALRVNELYHGVWAYPVEEPYVEVVAALQKKLKMRSCRVPIYVKIPKKTLEQIK